MKRPLGVTILAIIILILAIAYMGRAVTSDLGLEGSMRGEPWWFKSIPVAGRFGLGLLYGLIGVGLWWLRNWARGAFILLTVVGLTSTTLILFLKSLIPGSGLWTPPVWILILLFAYCGLVIYYFMRADVKRVFAAK
jgi:hypothetical protein